MFIKIFGTAVTFGHLFCNDTEIFEIAGTDRTTHAKQEIGFRGRKSEEWSIKRSTTLLSFKRLIDAYSRTAGRPKRDILHLTLYGRYVLKSPTEKLIQSVKSGGFFFPYSSERVFFFLFFFFWIAQSCHSTFRDASSILKREKVITFTILWVSLRRI